MPQNNLNLRIKLEPVTIGEADAQEKEKDKGRRLCSGAGFIKFLAVSCFELDDLN